MGRTPAIAWVPLAQAYERVEEVIGSRARAGEALTARLRTGQIGGGCRLIVGDDAIEPLPREFWRGITVQRRSAEYGGELLVLDREAYSIAAEFFVLRNDLDRLYATAEPAISATEPRQQRSKGGRALQQAVDRMLALHDEGDPLSGPKAVQQKIKERYGEAISISTSYRALSHVRQLIAARRFK